jgi:monoamine oxidase
MSRHEEIGGVVSERGQERGQERDMVSRRGFLQRVGMIGGSAAVLAALDAWDMSIASAQNAPPALSGSGRGKHIVVIGAGVAGLAAAHELGRLGYKCTIIEARQYSGGRVLVARHGFSSQELGGEKQHCEFDAGQYFNLGPMRIPYTHRSTLHYIREFGVPVEIMVNDNDAAWVHYQDAKGSLAGQRLRQYAVKADLRGYTNEIIAKAAGSGKLDDVLSKEDKERFLAYLIAEGYLDQKDLAYKGVTGRGDEVGFGAEVNPGPRAKSDPLGFKDLLAGQMGRFYNTIPGIHGAAHMFQIVGGMDALPRAMEKQLRRQIRFGLEVRSIRQDANGVTVNYQDVASSKIGSVRADYCINTMPLSVLKNLDMQVSEGFKKAMASVSYNAVYKLAIQFKRRFWEQDDHIYGGAVRTDAPTGTIYLPSYGFLGRKGVVMSSYAFGGNGAGYSAKSLVDRREAALQTGERIWPGVFRQEAEGAYSIAWHRMQYSLGGWAQWSDAARQSAYPLLNEADGRIYLAGEHLSYLNGWMAGSFESVWQQIHKLHRRAQESS